MDCGTAGQGVATSIWPPFVPQGSQRHTHTHTHMLPLVPSLSPSASCPALAAGAHLSAVI